MIPDALIAEVRQQIDEEIPFSVRQLYTNFCLTLSRPEGALAGFFYGSALWKTPTEDSVWDLYVLVDSFSAVKGNVALRLAGALLPPNVYYFESRDSTGKILRSKIAVMTLAQFTAHCAAQPVSPQTWARFAQVTRLIATRDEATREKVIEAVAHAVVSFHRATAPWVAGRCSVAEFWQIGLKQTYASEFRAERHGRQDMLVEAMHTALMARSRALLEHHSLQGLTLEGEQMLSMLSPTQKKRQRLAQKGRNLISKAQHLLRLAKAAFTFVGGLDYLVYKIERHSGVRLEPTAFQRRHPLLGIGPLFVRGLRARAFR